MNKGKKRPHSLRLWSGPRRPPAQHHWLHSPMPSEPEELFLFWLQLFEDFEVKLHDLHGGPRTNILIHPWCILMWCMWVLGVGYRKHGLASTVNSLSLQSNATFFVCACPYVHLCTSTLCTVCMCEIVWVSLCLYVSVSVSLCLYVYICLCAGAHTYNAVRLHSFKII